VQSVRNPEEREMYLARVNDSTSKIYVFKIDEYQYMDFDNNIEIPNKLHKGWRYGKKYRNRTSDPVFSPGFAAIRESAAEAVSVVTKLRSEFL
jgi:hypothetical protein